MIRRWKASLARGPGRMPGETLAEVAAALTALEFAGFQSCGQMALTAILVARSSPARAHSAQPDTASGGRRPSQTFHSGHLVSGHPQQSLRADENVSPNIFVNPENSGGPGCSSGAKRKQTYRSESLS